MAEENILHFAVLLVTISILLSGIAIGVGRALGYKRIENFGIEELAQSVLNAAIVGAFAAIKGVVASISSDAVAGTVCAGAASSDAIAKLSCLMDSTNASLFLLLQELVKSLNIIAYYQTLKLDMTAFTIQPLANLHSVSDILSSQAFMVQMLMLLSALNLQIINFISQNIIVLVFPLGLAFRAFFATRKFGGFLISLSIALYILYPVFIMAFPNPEPGITAAISGIKNFTSSSAYAPTPILDLNSNNAIAEKLDALQGRVANAANASNTTITRADVSGDLTKIIQQNSNAIADAAVYSAIAPLLSLIVCIVFIKELGNILGGEIVSVSVMRSI